MSASISISDLSWSYADGQLLFSGVSLSFGRERSGLVGRNGVGKTTLLKLLQKELTPQTGKVICKGTLGVLRQTLQVDPSETIADLFGVAESMGVLRRAELGEANEQELANADWLLEARLAEALAKVGLEVSAETPLFQLSGGERTRASLAALIFTEPDFLLLDEPTNHLDRKGREAVIALLANWRSGAIVVSHDRELLETMDTIVELTPLGATKYGGNWSSYRAQKSLDLAAAQRELADAEKRVRDISIVTQKRNERQDRKSGAGKREGAKGGTPRILLGGRKDRSEKTSGENARLSERQRDQALHEASAIRQKIEVLQPLTVELPSTNLPTGKQVLELERVTFGYETNNPILSNFSLRIVGPERIAIAGTNGSGKSTLLNLITGSLLPQSGSVRVIAGAVMLDQQVSLLLPELSIRENFLRIHPQADENACRKSLARFMFRADAALQKAGTLSGGQLLRAGLACVFGGAAAPPLLILDEPTNHLDIDSMEAVENGLRAYDGALLVVSHDETFLEAIGITQRVQLTRGDSD